MILSGIQSEITEFYNISLDYSVADFLCTEEDVVAAAGQPERGEVLLIAEDARGTWVGLYVDPNALSSLGGPGDPWTDGRFMAASLATEGVSHFVYVMYRESYQAGVSELELELQAEVDKYVRGVLGWAAPQVLLRGFGVGLIERRSRTIRSQVFDDAQFLDDAGTESGDRYRMAHRQAARYAAKLEHQFLRTGNVQGWTDALRKFYRAGLTDKLRMASSH